MPGALLIIDGEQVFPTVSNHLKCLQLAVIQGQQDILNVVLNWTLQRVFFGSGCR